MSVDLNRPPYVQWEIRPMEDREASLKNGHWTAKDIEIAVIMRPGSKDKTDKIAAEFLAEIREKARKGEIPDTWPQAIQSSYDFWKKGAEEPVNGTSLRSWPVLSPAQIQNIVKAGIFTVEDLAALPDSQLDILGIGGINLRQKARSWLEAAEEKGKLAEKNAALTAEVADLRRSVDELNAKFIAMKASKAS